MNAKRLIPLTHLPIGETERVKYIEDSHMKRRFLDLGLTPNTIVKTERYSPSGNPIAYRFRATIIAIRREEAENIFVSR